MHTEEQLFRWCRECLMILFTLKVCVQSVAAKGELGDTSLCLCASVCVCVQERLCICDAGRRVFDVFCIL